MFPKLTTAERVQTAKHKTHRVVDHLLYLLALHESNAIVVYSERCPCRYRDRTRPMRSTCSGSACPALRSYGCARFGTHRAQTERASLQSSDFNDHPDVIDALVEETRTTALVGVNDPALAELSASIEEQAQRKTAEARAEIEGCIRRGQEIEHSPSLASVKSVRDKHLAHSLSPTATVAPMHPGDEVNLLLDSIPLVRALYLWVNGTDFSFDNSREIARRNAEALWDNCAFSIQSRGELRKD